AIEEDAPYVSACAEYVFLKTQWTLTRNGSVAAHRELSGNDWEPTNSPISGNYLYGFDAEPGTYQLNVEVLQDATCLNPRKPRLPVTLSDSPRAAYDFRYNVLQFFSLVSFAAGLFSLIAHRLACRNVLSQRVPLVEPASDKRAGWGLTHLHMRPGRRPF